MINVHVEQLMTEDAITVERSQTLADAGNTMTEAEINSVIVSDAENNPVGILTSTDFVEMAANERSPAENTVADYMSSDIVTAMPDTSVHDAADLMTEHEISHLPVVNDDGSLTGIVTTTDVAAYVSGPDLLQ